MSVALEYDVPKLFCQLPQALCRYSARVADGAARLYSLAKRSDLYEDQPLPYTEAQVREAALYHEIGFLFLPEGTWQSRNSLTEEQRSGMKKHPVYGGRLLEQYCSRQQFPPGTEPEWRLAAEIAVTHHERWDGRGYPFGQIATSVCLPSRAVSVIGCFDQLMQCSVEKDKPFFAINGLKIEADKRFDSRLIDLIGQDLIYQKDFISIFKHVVEQKDL